MDYQSPNLKKYTSLHQNKKKQILVTGIAGFIGSNVAQRLLRDGHGVVGVDNLSNGFKENVPTDAELLVMDLANKNIINQLPGNIDVILHLAGQASGENSFYEPIIDLNQNVVSTLNLIRYGIKSGAHRLVFASSMSCYGDVSGDCAQEDMVCHPKSCYAVAKLAAEQYLKIFENELPYAIFRLFNVYGPGQNLANLRQGMVSIFLAQALQGKKVHVKGSLDRFRDFIEISDVVEAFTIASTSNLMDGKTLNLGTGQPTTVKELLHGLKIEIPDMSWYTKGSTPGDQTGLYADTRRLKEVLQFEAKVNIKSGLASFTDWARKQMSC